jgi:hypothetical protein
MSHELIVPSHGVRCGVASCAAVLQSLLGRELAEEIGPPTM